MLTIERRLAEAKLELRKAQAHAEAGVTYLRDLIAALGMQGSTVPESWQTLDELLMDAAEGARLTWDLFETARSRSEIEANLETSRTRAGRSQAGL
jgi:hypothetical protein